MNPQMLPKVGMPVNALTAKSMFCEWGALRAKSVLCIGFCEEEIDELILPAAPKEVTLLTNWVDHRDAVSRKYKIDIGDITKRTLYEDRRFDAVCTLSLLEHVSSLRATFEELKRITVVGGEHLHLFGPSWSSPFGHHLYAAADDPQLNFSLWQLPAHLHLLSTRDEIHAYFAAQNYGESTINTVLDQMFTSEIINRCTYDEYVALMTELFQIERLQTLYHPLPSDHRRMLQSKFPDVADFATYGAKVRLINI
jgi:hypothetical protein